MLDNDERTILFRKGVLDEVKSLIELTSGAIFSTLYFLHNGPKKLECFSWQI
jgi:hypothetical protein